MSHQSHFGPPSVKIKHGQHIRSEKSFKVTYRGCLPAHPAEHIKEGAMHTFLDLGGTVTHVNLCWDLLALHSALALLLRLLKNLGVVRAGCPLASGVVCCVC